MGWQKRSSGHKYDSTSGHGFMLGARTKKIIDSQCMSKECRVCTKYANDETPPPDHDCVKNHIGSSKSMEPEAIFRMVNRAFDVLMFTVAVITSDDDSSMKSTLKHSWQLLIEKGFMKKSEWPVTLKGHKKTDNGRLPLHIPEPTFLADFNHRVKVLGGKIYGLANASKKESEVDKGFAARLKAYWGAMLKQVKHLVWSRDEKEIREKTLAHLEHLFDNRQFCGDWCYKKQAITEKVLYIADENRPFYCKKKNHKMYLQVKSEIERFQTEDMIKDCLHSLIQISTIPSTS